MTNVILNKCPICGHGKVDIQGAIIKVEGTSEVSYNLYKCLKKPHQFLIKRKGDVKEQKLTEKFIKSEAIMLKKIPRKIPKRKNVTLIKN